MLQFSHEQTKIQENKTFQLNGDQQNGKPCISIEVNLEVLVFDGLGKWSIKSADNAFAVQAALATD